ncbi:MAG TPA: UDP-N-acetylmuramate dehydrogenase [Verrucomicrobiae bacterium]|nr:UDP-N-acetylmuramate dehydrogenase [Verrucomicrobiae bacterium]
MDIRSHFPLKELTTMRLGGEASVVIEVISRDELVEAIQAAKKRQLPFFVMGGGSNIIARDDGFKGVLILNRIPGFDVLSDDGLTAIVKIGAGENWDETVRKTVEINLSGIEAMSAIPGTAGATPVQNVGAYGQEIADTLTELEAYDLTTNSFVTLQNADCGFSYRHSIFKSTAARRYVIVSITLKLRRVALTPPFYASLQKYLDDHNIHYYTPQVIRDAVIDIRREKLPDPKLLPNTGSFFKNPIIEPWLYQDLLKTYPDMPAHQMADGNYKVPAGWLIEQANLKGYKNHGMRTYEKNALAIINDSATSYKDLAAFRDEIIGKVRDTFRITLEQEPEEL